VIDGILKTLGLVAIAAVGYQLGKRAQEGQPLLRLPRWALPDELWEEHEEERVPRSSNGPRRVN
jgi:hypothetical protein